MSILLSADIGGTKTILQMSSFESGALSTIKVKHYKSAQWQSFESLLDDFLQTPHDVITTTTSHANNAISACFAVAGPLTHISSQKKNQQYTKPKEQTNNDDIIVNVTNLPWQLSRNALINQYQFSHLAFINDFEAIAYATEQLNEDDLFTLQTGLQLDNTPDTITGSSAFIGAGTGLGQAISIFDGLDYRVIRTEGGHCDFAPNSDFEVALYQFLNQKYTHVSYERLLSGDGLYNIYQFFLQICHSNKTIIKEKNIIESHHDKAEAISREANMNPDGLSARTLSLFFRIYGAQAGNLALTCLPSGGIFIAGGIALKNIEYMKTSDFLLCFNAKGRMQPLMENIPVKIITNAQAGLLGATNVALRQIHKTSQKH